MEPKYAEESTQESAALRAWMEMLAVIVLAAVASWFVAGTVTPADCVGQTAQPSALVWILLIVLTLVGPGFGRSRARALGLTSGRRFGITTTGTIVAISLLMIVLVFRMAPLDCG